MPKNKKNKNDKSKGKSRSYGGSKSNPPAPKMKKSVWKHQGR